MPARIIQPNQPFRKPPPGTARPETLPIHLTAVTTLASFSTGGVNAIALKNPFGAPMEILEVKFAIEGAAAAQTNPLFGGCIACKMDLGQIPLTNGFVPVWGFGRAESLFLENVVDPTFGAGIGEYCWRLPVPLYVPANAVITPTFQHRGLVPDELLVRISFSARSLPAGSKPPSNIAIPYAASYTSKSFKWEEAATDSSKETELVNPFAEQLFLQRFTGRCAVSATEAINQVLYTTEASVFLAQPEAGSQMMNVRMVDSFGTPIVRDFETFRQVFSGVTRAWELDNKTTMAPRSYYQVFLRKDVPLTSRGAVVTPLVMQTDITMTGWRYVVGGGK
jgi:hypothetical protein